MTRYLASVLVLAACGGKQPPPSGDDTEPVATFDAAPTPVVVATPDAEPPAPPQPPEVPAQGKTADVDELSKMIKGSSDNHQHLIWYGWMAEALWAESCPSATDGLCLKTTPRGKKALATCDQRTADTVAKPRPEKALAKVAKAIGSMRQLWGDGSILTEVTDFETQADAYVQNTYMAEEVAAAILILGDQELEALYAIKAPTGLSYTGATAKASLKKFDDWFKALSAQGTKTVQTYELLLGDSKMKQWAPAGVVEALARYGDTMVRFADAIEGVELGKDMKDPDVQTAFCDTMAEKAEPLRAQAAQAYDSCMTTANEAGINNDTVVRCAAEVQRLRPAP